MQNKIKVIIAGLVAMVMATLIAPMGASALPANWKPNKDAKEDQLQRTVKIYDVRKNTVSNIQFYTSNYGIFGLDVERNTGGGYWPRGSANQYIFGGGIWFGAKKWAVSDSGVPFLRKYCVVSYDPNQGGSWMVPGRIEKYDGTSSDVVDETGNMLYRTYLSTDFNKSTGEPNDQTETYNWPIWDTQPLDSGYRLSYDRYFGRFVNNPTMRNTTSYPKGPAFISQEDIFASFKDTDLSKYKIGPSVAKKRGYPLRLQMEQMIYSWGFGNYKDFVFIKYDIINMSEDSLRECWMSPMMDVDVARAPYTSAGATNDRVKYYKPSGWDSDPLYKDTLNLAMQWTMNTQGEDGKGFGYLGYDFLESPATYIAMGDTVVEENGVQKTKSWMWSTYAMVYPGEKNPVTGVLNNTQDTIKVGLKPLVYDKQLEGFVRKDKAYYETKEQLGLISFRNWNIEQDKKDDQEFYDFMSEIGDNGYIRDGDEGPGDKRFMMATGPFSMLPKDTVRVVVGILIALPSVQREADGSDADVAGLVKLDMFAQSVYDNNFRAPAPPNNTFFLGYKSYNNAIEVDWDSTAEMTTDNEETGLDFMGYRLYRARETDLDTFNVDRISADAQYTKGRGPFGWKYVAGWEMPTPFNKLDTKGTTATDGTYPYVDDFDIVGWGYKTDEVTGNVMMDTMALTIMRYPKGLLTHDGSQMGATYATPILSGYRSTETVGWPKYFNKYWDWNLSGFQPDPFKPISQQATNVANRFMVDSVLYGTIKINSSLCRYNPLYWYPITVEANARTGKDTTWTVDPKDTTKKIISSINYEWVAFEPGYDTSSTFKTTYAKFINEYKNPQNGGDTLYLYNTIRAIEMKGETKYYFTEMVPLYNNSADSWKAIFSNPSLLAYAKKELLTMIQGGLIDDVTFGDVAGSKEAKDSVIVPYMSELTHGRKYFDIGDDNGTGVIDLSDESTLTEKILNNIPYYYKLEAYDEGDWMKGTPEKFNDGSGTELPNNITAYAKSGRPVDYSNFEITYQDTNKLGGVKNIQFFTVEKERVNQILAGKTLELEFNPSASVSEISIPGKEGHETLLTTYVRTMTLKDSATGDVLFNGYTYFDPNGGAGPYTTMQEYTENAFSAVLADSAITDTISGKVNEFGLPTNNDKVRRIGSYSTGDFNIAGYNPSYQFTNGYQNTFGFKFDFAMEQRGGVIRQEGMEKVSGDATTPLHIFKTPTLGLAKADYTGSEFYSGTQNVGIYDYMQEMNTAKGSYLPYAQPMAKQWNAGPGEFLVTFKDGGTEQMTLTYNNNSGAKTATFTVPYLTYNIVNKYSFTETYTDGKQHEVKYGLPYEFMQVPETSTIPSFYDAENKTVVSSYTCHFPHPKNLGKTADDFMGKYTSFATGFVNGRGVEPLTNGPFYDMKAVREGDTLSTSYPNLIGQQGRYYLSATSGDATVDFVNVLNIGGTMFIFDYANRGSFITRQALWDREQTAKNWTYGQDFKAGDQVLCKVTGGCFGMPLKGAKVRVKVKATEVADNKYSEDQLKKVKVVPNPYYISHEAQRSAYDTKLYFTKLPAKCTIDIYTVTGDLVKTINHNEAEGQYGDYRTAMDVWDLYSSNNQRVQSQTFVAVITTPDGTQQSVKFTVLVGSTRLIAD